MFTRFFELVFPTYSLTGVEGSWITDEERARLTSGPIALDRAALQKVHIRSIDLLVAAGVYETSPLLRKAIHAFKYRRAKALAFPLAEKMVAAIPKFLALPDEMKTDVILCPVPLHWSRRFERGFNQSKILADLISAQIKWPVAELITRTKATGRQVGRTRGERIKAMQHVFRFYPTMKVPRCVVLIDDVCTTGATLDACAEALKNAGVTFVAALAAAKD
jgi:ComF family protein